MLSLSTSIGTGVKVIVHAPSALSPLALSCFLVWCGALSHEILIEPSDRAPDGVNLNTMMVKECL